MPAKTPAETTAPVGSELDTLSPLSGHPGVHSCPRLKRLMLGVVPTHKLLYCIACAEGSPSKKRLLYVKTAAAHLKKEHDFSYPKLDNVIQEWASKHNLHQGQLEEVPIPQTVVHPFPFLTRESAHQCLICKGNGKRWFGTSDSSRITHFTTLHRAERSRRTSHEKLVYVQTFLDPPNGRLYFEVNLDIPPTCPQEDEDAYELNHSTSEQLVHAYVENYTPIRLQLPKEVSLKETHPFLVFTGWAKHTQTEDASYLCSLISVPAEGSSLRRLYDRAVGLFHEEQKIYPDVLPIWLSNLMDDGTGHPSRPFRALQSSAAADSYAQTWGRWACFLVRLHQEQSSANPKYPIRFNGEQERTLQRAWAYCNQKVTAPSGKRLLAEMARWFWRAQDAEYFSHLAVNQFNDPTVRFAALMNLREDGSYLDPRNSTHNLVQVKYMIRSGLFMWSRLEAEEERDTFFGMLERIRESLRRSSMTPFACVADAVSTGTTYAASSIHLPNVMWVSDNELTVEGQRINVEHFRRQLNRLIADTRELLMQKVLLGLTLEELGYTVTSETHILDNPAETKQGYSFLDEEKNVFRSLQTRLATRFLSDPRGSHMHQGVNAKGKIVWVAQAANVWLKHCEEVTENLALLMHITGGQPGRGVEFCLVTVKNTLHRVRGVYILGPGRVVVLLAYNKTTSNTGRDWIVAHAVPWCVGELFFIMQGLVNPLAGVLVEEFAARDGRIVQETSAWASFGQEFKTDRLARIVEKWSIKALGVEMKIRRLRHLIIAIQHHLMPEACSPFKKSIMILDAQAGHTSETAREHYAIDVNETHSLASNTVVKEIAASARWWLVCIDRGNLTPAEIGEANSAPATISREDTVPIPVPSAVQPREVTKALTATLEDPEVLGSLAAQLSDHLGPHLSSLLAGLSLSEGAARFPAPRRLKVEPAHEDVLQRFCLNKEATFRTDGQGQAFLHVLERNVSLVVILATGTGKSVLFGAMPIAESGITVVIIPLRAVARDQIAASRRRKPLAPFQEWSLGAHFEDGVVVSSIESAGKPAFATWLDVMKTQLRLNRIVVDEAHMVVTEADYRVAMRNLQGLVEAGVPIVCLSATMPPTTLPALHRALGRPSFNVIRESTLRSNIALHALIFASRDAAVKALQRHARRYQSELEAGEGILIQCRTRDDSEQMARSLRAPCYHGGMHQDDKDDAALRWISGAFPTIAGTSGLGTGVNHPRCRAALHLHMPYGTTDYAQEVGRTGRDGKPAIAIIFTWRPLPTCPDEDPKGYAVLAEAVNKGACLQHSITGFLDGSNLAKSCSGAGALRCGPCKRGLARSVLRAVPNLADASKGTDQEAPVVDGFHWAEEHLPTFADRAGSSSVGVAGAREQVVRPTGQTMKTGTVLVPGTPSPEASQDLEDVPGKGKGRQQAEAGGGSLVWAPSDETSRGNAPPPSHEIEEIEDAGRDHTWQAAKPPPAPIGAQVQYDARESKKRRLEPPQPVPADEHAHRPYDLMTLLEKKDKLDEFCPLCIVYCRAFPHHWLGCCTHRPQTLVTLDEDVFVDKSGKEWTFKETRSGSKIPGGNLVCYWCWWPMSSKHGHPTGSAPECCSVKDCIPQLCWLAFVDDKLRAAPAAEFPGEKAKFNSGPKKYWEWVTTVKRTVTLHGQKTLLLNAHLVWLYFHGVHPTRTRSTLRAGSWE
ncbi:hypothetical protein FRC09_011290 [Ceratobasidium sp. 395]|nr:hypothetical protein FRC09_011290 [Ceratobasidium sp. 395]